MRLTWYQAHVQQRLHLFGALLSFLGLTNSLEGSNPPSAPTSGETLGVLCLNAPALEVRFVGKMVLSNQEHGGSNQYISSLHALNKETVA